MNEPKLLKSNSAVKDTKTKKDASLNSSLKKKNSEKKVVNKKEQVSNKKT